MEPELKSNLSRHKTWLRGLYMLLFAVLYHVAEFVLGAVVVLQFVFTLVSGTTNARLLQFGDNLSQYIYQVMQFLTYNSEQMPFPFDEWPSRDAKDEPTQ